MNTTDYNVLYDIAEKEPYHLDNPLGPQYDKLASIAWHLSLQTAPEPFFLLREKLGELFGRRDLRDITRLVNLLEMNHIIKCVDEDYRHTDKNKHKGKKYIFIGPINDTTRNYRSTPEA